MKKKPILLAAGAAALVLALLLAGLPLFSRLYYGRSQAATLFAWQLKKEAYTTQEAFEEYLAEKSEENALPYLLPPEVEFTVPVKPVAQGGQPGYVLNGDGSRVVFFFPGGSYIDQPRAVHWQFLNDLAERTGARIVVPIYRKLPDADGETSYEMLREFYLSCLEEDGPWKELIFMGDSAGGGMALSFAMQLRDEALPGPDRLLLICPWLDVALENPDIPAYERKDPALDADQLRHLGALWAGARDADDPMISPLYGDLDGLGKITLFTGTAELLYPDILRLDQALAEAGIDHETIVQPGMFHVWPLYHGYHIPESEETFEQIVELLSPAS